jgi:glycerol uptake facilitator-like aquaporin
VEHINPAVTIGLAIAGKFAWNQVAYYIVAQMIGAMLGAFLVWLFNKDHFAITDNEGGKLACFSTIPAIRNYSSNLISEIIGTFFNFDLSYCWTRTYSERRQCCKNRIGYHWCIACSHIGMGYRPYLWKECSVISVKSC